jgi:hypothetical protein
LASSPTATTIRGGCAPNTQALVTIMHVTTQYCVV